MFAVQQHDLKRERPSEALERQPRECWLRKRTSLLAGGARGGCLRGLARKQLPHDVATQASMPCFGGRLRLAAAACLLLLCIPAGSTGAPAFLSGTPSLVGAGASGFSFSVGLTSPGQVAFALLPVFANTPAVSDVLNASAAVDGLIARCVLQRTSAQSRNRSRKDTCH